MSEDTDVSTDTATDSAVSAPRAVVASVRRFVAAQGGSATAVIAPAGAAGVRLTLVGAEGGVLGDQVVDSVAVAEAVVAAVDGLETGEWDRELTSAAEPRPGHWRKMAGWVAHQTRFPKARNSAILD